VTNQTPIAIAYFSDVLCVWAYVTRIQLDEIVSRFGTDVKVDLKFCSVFGNSADKVSRGWADKRGYKGFIIAQDGSPARQLTGHLHS
jgi:hypothetical protein